MNIKRSLFRLAIKFKQADRAINAYERVFGGPPFNNLTVDDKIRNYNLPENEVNGYVLFPQLTRYSSHLRRFCALAHTFRTYGYEPIVLYNDDDLLIPPENTVEKNENVIREVKYQHRVQKYIEEFGLPAIPINDLTDKELARSSVKNTSTGQLRSFEHNGINLSDCAVASTRKFLKRYSIDLTDQNIMDTLKQFLLSGVLITEAVQKIVDKYDIRAAFAHEPNYIQGNIPMQVCTSNSIPVYTLGTGYHQDTIMVGKADSRHYMGQFASRELTMSAVQTQLSAQEREHIESIINKRKSGDNTHVKYTPETSLSVNPNDIDQEYTVGIFSHLLWDGALEPDQALYDDIYEWLDATLQVAMDNTETHYIIKSHPAEEIRGTNESTGEWIEEHYSPLPDHITFLPPDTDVNTYALIDALDAGIVYASTVGLEIALEGKPVLTGGYPPYHGCGVSFDPETKSEYHELLQDIEQVEPNTERKDRAYRFAHFLFVCKHLDFTYLSDSSAEIHFDHNKLTAEGSTCCSIVEQVLAEEEVLRPRCGELK